MPPVVAGIFSQFLYKPVVRPVVRIVCGLVAIPLFRFLLRKVLRVRTTDVEMERDLEHWFRGAVLLLAATANLEDFLFGWTQWHQHSEPWLTMLLRLLLAIGVIETMPDEDIFGIVHKGPPKFKPGRGCLVRVWRQRRDWLRGMAVMHLKRSSPVLVIMCVIFGGSWGTLEWKVGWWCYGLALVQYLIIALSTDRGRAAGLLAAMEAEMESGPHSSHSQHSDRMRHAAGACGVFAGEE